MGNQQTPILTQPPGVTFDASSVSPANGVYITPADTLLLTLWSFFASQTVQVSARIILPDGTVSFNIWQYITLGSRIAERVTFNLPEGFLISCNVVCQTTTPDRGSLFVVVQIQRGAFGNILYGQTLCQGYLTFEANVFYPGAQNGYSFEGRGHIISITGTTPAAGAEISESVPVGAYWRLLSFGARLTTNATAGNRTSALVVQDQSFTTVLVITPPQLIPASSANSCYYAPGLVNGTINPGSGQTAFPIDFYLPAGWRIRTSTSGLLGTDQYAAPQYVVEEWLQV